LSAIDRERKIDPMGRSGDEDHTPIHHDVRRVRQLPRLEGKGLTQRRAGMSVATNANTDGNAAAWHALSADDVMKRLATDGKQGLDASDVSPRFGKYGPNRLPEGKKRGPFMRFLAQFNNILVYVLLGA
jgi:magnesium-transporting ATPase (P-type)